jgi:hypothetical protein
MSGAAPDAAAGADAALQSERGADPAADAPGAAGQPPAPDPAVGPSSEPPRETDPLVVLGMLVGVLLVLPALWALWTDLLLPPGWWRGPEGLGAALAGGLLVWGVVRFRRGRGPAPAPPRRAWRIGAAQGSLLLLLVLSLWTRLAEIRGLEIPFFGDSVHHSMIVRLFQLRDGLPDNWLPFAPLASFSYHFGFHALAAAIAAAADLSAPRAVLVSGQLLMVLQILTLYSLAAGLTRRPWAGFAAGLSPMPAYYLNWGRYTQLAGQVLLPVAALLAVRAATAPSTTARRWVGPAAAMLLGAGLFVTHYLVAGFGALLVLGWLVVVGWRGVRAGPGFGRGGIGRIGPIGPIRPMGPMSPMSPIGPIRPLKTMAHLSALALGTLLLTAPWLPRLGRGLILKSATSLATTRVANPDVYGVLADGWAMWRPDALARNVGWPLIVAAGLGLVVLLLARREEPVGAAEALSPRGLGLLGLVWLGLLLLATYPRLLGLPITGVLKDFTVAIAAYLPLGLVLGGGVAALAEWVGSRGRLAGRALSVAAVVVAVAVTWRGRTARDDGFRLVLPDDLKAMAWIREHTPPDARFLVSSFAAFGQTVQAGDDAGWWLPLLAAPRSSTLPPITIGLEASLEPGYREAVNQLAELWRADLDAPATLRALSAAGVTHAYVGVTGKVLDRARLAASPCWEPLFVADADGADGRPGAEVYRFKGPRCQEPPPPSLATAGEGDGGGATVVAELGSALVPWRRLRPAPGQTQP